MKTVLVCFAVKEEAMPFRKILRYQEGVGILITGMGRNNAEKTVREALKTTKPDLVLTCGFAGGLKPDLPTGAVIYDTNPALELDHKIEAAGARAGRFVCASRVATSVAEKLAWREKSRADAVEMESEAIRLICDEHGIPSVTLRVVLDAAGEDLPLDFNGLMTSDQRMSYLKLALALARSPWKIPALLWLQRQSRFAAERLGAVLAAFLGEVLHKAG